MLVASQENELEQRLSLVTLRRAALTSACSIVATSVMLFVAAAGDFSQLDQFVFVPAFANLGLNFMRFIYGLTVLFAKKSPVSSTWISRFKVVSHAINILWIAMACGIYNQFGLRNEASIFCMLVTCALVPCCLLAFATIPDLSIGSMFTMCAGTTFATVQYGHTYVDTSIGGIAMLYFAFLTVSSHELYSVLLSNERKIVDQDKENDLMKSLINAVPGFMTLLDQELRYVMVNNEFAKHLGRDVLGERFGFTNQDPEFYAIIETFASSGKDQDLVETVLGEKFNKSHFLVSLTRIHGSQDLIAVLTMNIEAQKKAESELMRARSDAEHSSRLVALGEMISSVAHEIRNPLTIINGRAANLIRLADKGALQVPPVVDASKKISEMVDRINKIIQTILKFGRDETDAPMAKVQLKHIFEDAALLTELKCRASGVELRVNPVEGSLTIDCHALKLAKSWSISSIMPSTPSRANLDRGLKSALKMPVRLLKFV